MIQRCAEYRYCPECRDERLFERFHAEDCPDVPGAHPDLDCPEWGCIRCGTALIIDPAVPGYMTVGSVSRAA